MSDKFIGPHQGQPVMATGLPLAEAQAAMIMVHGRGGYGRKHPQPRRRIKRSRICLSGPAECAR